MVYLVTILFMIIPILSIPVLLLGICTSKKYRLWLLLLLAIIFAIFSYYFEPSEVFDLSRYFKVMEYIRYNITSIVDLLKVIKYEPLFSIILYVISKIGNYNLLSCFLTLICYFIIFYIIDDYAKKINLSNVKTFIILLFFITTFNYIYFASGLRNSVGFIIAIIAIYLEYVKNKKGIMYKILYIIPCFFHNSLFIIIIFRVIMMLDYNKFKKIYIILMIGVFFSSSFIVNISNILSYIPILEPLAQKSVIYTYNYVEIANMSVILLYSIIVAIFNCIIFLYNTKSKKINYNKELYKWISMSLILCIATMPYNTMSSRFLVLYNLMSIFTLADFLKNEKNKNNFFCIIIILFAVMFIGCLCQYTSLKNADFGNLLSEGIIKNIFTIFYKV